VEGIVGVKEFGVVISAAHRQELRRVSPLVVLFQKDLPNEWPTSVAQLSSMTQCQNFARLLAGDIVESISSRTARHSKVWPHRLRCGSSGVLVDPAEDVPDQVDD
jgi:hypothetical protein